MLHDAMYPCLAEMTCMKALTKRKGRLVRSWAIAQCPEEDISRSGSPSEGGVEAFRAPLVGIDSTHGWSPHSSPKCPLWPDPLYTLDYWTCLQGT